MSAVLISCGCVVVPPRRARAVRHTICAWRRRRLRPSARAMSDAAYIMSACVSAKALSAVAAVEKDEKGAHHWRRAL